MNKNHNQIGQSHANGLPAGAAPLFQPWIIVWFLITILTGCDFKQPTGPVTSPSPTSETPTCKKVVHADVVALDQVYFYNRFGAFNPAGMMYALRKDVVSTEENDQEEVKGTPLSPDKTDKADTENNLKPGQVRLRSDKRPRPLVLRVNEGDCLHVKFTNLLSPAESGQDVVADPETAFSRDKDKRLTNIIDSDEPATRHASIHVNGLDLVSQKEAKRSGVAIEAGIGSQGANVGLNGWKDTDGRCATDSKDFGQNLCALAAPGETREYLWYAKKEGGYLFYSMAAPAGGEGDGGQVGLGLFGAVNVQPKGATWYRSQVTHDDLIAANEGQGLTEFDQPKINYQASYKSGPFKDQPILRMLDDHDNIVYSDLNAVIDINGEGDKNYCKEMGEGNSCGKPYREFTTIFHDELTVVQAFHELSEEDLPISALRDGHGINYGSAGLGAMVLANRRPVPSGPTADCPECKLEEFFLTSWANGDPALVLGEDSNGQKHAMFPNDPSNVHHSYIGDPVRFRNMHAGPKETHVFHLHAHQWVQDKHDPNSLYLDSQTISPGAVFSYEIHYGGSGNRNLTPGDSIFHCHLYPHFAQGMWELWRSHDVFEDGTPGLYDAKNNNHGRNLPDYEIAEGTPNPALVPLPQTPLPPMPSEKFRGYPFYIAGVAGHRPPQAPLDLDIDPKNPDNTTLERHLIVGGSLKSVPENPDKMTKGSSASECKTPNQSTDLYGRGRLNSACIAGKVKQAAGANQDIYGLARELESARIKRLDINGTEDEQQAIKYHQGQLELPKHGLPHTSSDPGWKPTPYNWDAPGYSTVQCDSAGKCDKVLCDSAGKCDDVLFRVNGRDPKPGAPYADPCPDNYFDAERTPHKVVTRDYRAAYVQFDMPVNKAGWHDPQARIAVLEDDVKGTLDGSRPAEPLFFRAKSGECIQFKATNLIPSNLNLDDFQVYSPTDVIGQHIHLVKFDVTSSDGSGNGWNYEDGTLAADEIRERIIAHNRWVKDCQVGKHKAEECTDLEILHPKTHPMFKPGGSMAGDRRGYCADLGGEDDDFLNHPWCGAQTTTQRWWADPLLNKKPGQPGATDRTIRTVFTHDHFGPSSHQHHGLYAALVIEPSNSKWEYPDGRIMGGADPDGNGEKPATGIIDPKTNKAHKDGGPTHYAANVIVKSKGKACVHFDPKKNPECVDSDDTLDPNKTVREFNLAFADYSLVYDARNKPVNPTNRVEGDLPVTSVQSSIPIPEGISAKDPGTQLINYRNEPIPLRIGKLDDSNVQYTQKTDFASANGTGNMANVFSTMVHKQSDKFNDNSGYPIFTEKEGRGRGDPATPLLRAYDGDRVQIRLIQGAQEENHVFTMNGVKWLSQAGSDNSGYTNGQQIGISEHFEFNAQILSPTPNVRTTDFLYSSSATDNLWDGQWGLLRTFKAGLSQKDTGIRAFPTSHPVHPDISGKICGPVNAEYKVSAWRVTDLAKDLRGHKVDTTSILPGDALPYNRNMGIQDPNAIIFLENDDYDALLSGNRKSIEPLILRARAGDCIRMILTNKLPETILDGSSKDAMSSWSYNQMPPITSGLNFNQVTLSNRVGMHAQLVAMNVAQDDGANVGNNEISTIGPNEPARTYYWYAGEYSVDKNGQPKPIPLELGAAALTDMGDVIKHGSHGAKGALVIEPKDALYTKRQKDGGLFPPKALQNQCGEDPNSNASANICDAEGNLQFREFVLIYQDDVSSRRFGEPLPNLRNADDAEDTGQKAFNYGTEPIWGRVGAGPADDPGSMNEQMWANVFSSRVGNDSCSKEDHDKHQCTLDPATPVFTAEAGTPVRFRIVHPSGHPRNHAFTLFGHDWIMNPWQQGSSVMGWNKESSTRIGSTSGIGPMRHVNILASAGGCFKVPGDYLYRTQEGFMFGGGLWGIFRVKPEESPHKIPDTCWVASNRKD